MNSTSYLALLLFCSIFIAPSLYGQSLKKTKNNTFFNSALGSSLFQPAVIDAIAVGTRLGLRFDQMLRATDKKPAPPASLKNPSKNGFMSPNGNVEAYCSTVSGWVYDTEDPGRSRSLT